MLSHTAVSRGIVGLQIGLFSACNTGTWQSINLAFSRHFSNVFWTLPEKPRQFICQRTVDKVIQELLCPKAGNKKRKKKQAVCTCVCFFYSFDFLKITVILWVLLHIQRFLKQTKKEKEKKIIILCIMLKSTGICEVDLLSCLICHSHGYRM